MSDQPLKAAKTCLEPKAEFINRVKTEYTLLQSKIDRYGDSSLKFKGFALTVTLAAGSLAIKEGSLLIPALGILAMLVFLYYEAVNNIYYQALKSRAYKIERAITNATLRKKIISPYIGHELKGQDTTKFRNIRQSVNRAWQSNIFYCLMISIFIFIMLFNYYRSIVS